MLKLLIRLVLAAAILVAAVFISGQLVKNGPQEPPEEEATPAVGVEVVPIRQGAWHPESVWSGQVSARNRVSISAPRATRVESIQVEAGARVEAGTGLLELDRDAWVRDEASVRNDLDEIRLQRQQMNSRHETQRDALALEREMLAQAERALAREQNLQQRGASTQAALEQAENQVLQRRQAVLQSASSVANQETELATLGLNEKRAQRQMERLAEEAPRLTPEAPFSGRVENIHVSAGQQVGAGTNLMDLYAENSLVWRVNLPAGTTKVEAWLNDSWEPLERVLASTGNSPARQGEFALSAASELVPGETLSTRVRQPLVADTQLLPPRALFDGDRVYVVGADNRLEAVLVEQVGVTRIQGRTWLIVGSEKLPAEGQILATRVPDVLAGMAVSVKQVLTLPAPSAEAR